MTTGVHDKYLDIFLSMEILMLKYIRLFPFKPNFPLHTGHKKLHKKSIYEHSTATCLSAVFWVLSKKLFYHNYLSNALKLQHRDHKSLLCTYLVWYEFNMLFAICLCPVLQYTGYSSCRRVLCGSVGTEGRPDQLGLCINQRMDVER